MSVLWWPSMMVRNKPDALSPELMGAMFRYRKTKEEIAADEAFLQGKALPLQVLYMCYIKRYCDNGHSCAIYYFTPIKRNDFQMNKTPDKTLCK